MRAYSNSRIQSFLKNQQLLSYSKIPRHLQKLNIHSLVHSGRVRIGISIQTRGIIQQKKFQVM